MKIMAYALTVAVVMVFLSSGTGGASLREGNHPGDIAPRIELAKNDAGLSFPYGSGRYTLVLFWASYDAKSRMKNVRLWHRLKKGDLPEVEMVSVSMDKYKSVFEETIKADGLTATNQLYDGRGELSTSYRKYGLKKGFKNFLIDEKGVIVATDVTPEKIGEIINKHS
ncbi:MAG: thioredoxin family protein [Tannerella sp.]|jgi:hypothetical protein|nr:thioredoxin family protein [Tannerella sp.]